MSDLFYLKTFIFWNACSYVDGEDSLCNVISFMADLKHVNHVLGKI